MPGGIIVDFSRPPNQKERGLLQRRRRRLDALAAPAGQSARNMEQLALRSSLDHVRIRYEFVFKGGELRGDPSDRHLPAPADRAPASRLISPRGAALRFFLTALLEAQAGSRPGQQPANTRPLQGGGAVLSWADLLASDATPAGSGRTYMGVAAKKARQVQSALRRLAGEELVALTRQKAASRKYEEFVLLHEGGRREHGPNVPYQVPFKKEGFTVPVELFSRGWIHVLEDTELAFILMIATCHHLQGGREFRLASADRLLRFGIGRDAYEAHKLLSRLQLLRVSADPDRHTDGTVEGYNSGTTALPHLFQFLPVGFDEDAVTAVREQIDYQLARS